ncbi:MAG: folate-binding protein [Chromatiales bacterium]|nr:folate-binding protein [Chromatiales bacterium]
MLSQWQKFLTNHHPITDSPLSIDENILVDLPHLGIIEAKGDDCDEFLQGQLTNDIRLLTPSTGQLSGYCSPKGRILALLRMFKRDDSIFMLLPKETLEATLKRLTMFVMRSQVVLSDESPQWVCFGISGPDAATALAAHTSSLPEGESGVISNNELTLLSLSPYQQRYILFTTADKAEEIWGSISSSFTVVPQAQWDLLDIHAGLPHIEASTVEAFVPQMVNLQFLNGINFKKGCYTGQEVVARMQYLGKLKRRMYHAHVATSDVPKVGDEIESPQSSSGQGAGKIVTVAPSPDGGFELLVVAETESAEKGSLHLKGSEAASLTITELPYSVEATV